MSTPVHGLTVEEWRALLASEDEHAIREALKARLDITELDSKALVQ